MKRIFLPWIVDMTAIFPAAMHSGQCVPEPLSQTGADWPSLVLSSRLVSILLKQEGDEFRLKKWIFQRQNEQH